MARSKVSCRWVPEVPGTHEDSKMYIELTKLIKNRPLTNLIYASYLQDGVADKMDSSGYTRNPQGQHRARDIYSFFNVSNMKNALPVNTQAKAVGFMDSNGNLVDFNAVDAFTKAQNFNQTTNSRVAYVVQHGDMFNVLLDERDSRSQVKQVEVNRGLTQWGELSAQLTARGIDINDLNSINPGLVNPGTVAAFVRNLSAYKMTPNDGLSVKDIEMLLALNPTVPIVQNILSRGWGTREETAQRMYDVIHNGTATATNVTLVNNVLNEAKKLNKLDVGRLRNSIRAITTAFEASDESFNIQKTLNDLDAKYHLESDSFIRNSNSIEKYSEAVADAIMSLQRQIRVIESRSGKTSKSESLRTLKDKLVEELKHKQYASGLLDFMNTAVSYIKQVNNTLNSVPNTGTNLEFAHNLAEATSQATNLRNAYYDVVKAISDTELVNDFAINDTDKDALKSLAKDIKQLFDSQNEKIRELQKEAMVALGKEFIGEHNSLYGKDLADIVNMTEADTSLTDYLYGVGRSTNTVVSMLGAIIRDAQSQRDIKLQEVALQIRRANNLLVKDGKDSSFMYDDKGRIVSEYDWDAYTKAKRKYAGKLVRSGIGYKSAQFEAEMQLWEDNNTVEVVVDNQSGRTERFPAFKLSKNFRDGWSSAQNEYYDRMMEIKGQIGTLLPNYAQHQYIAPQKRTSWDQVLKEGLRGDRSFVNVAKWFLENSKIWKMKEADTRFRKSGIFVEGEESLASLSSYDNTILRQIPLFFVKKIDKNNLSHDFSSALQSLASTALNYEAMEGIKDLAEMMTDYASNSTPVERDVTGKPRVDISFSDGLNVVTNLRKSAKSNGISNILDSFVLKHIYGVENKSEGLWSVICANLIGYTSLKGLAVNVKGALTNKWVGVIQTLIKASGGQYYSFKDLAKAEGILLGEQGGSTTGALIGGLVGGGVGAAVGLAAGTAIGAKGMTGKFMDIITDNRNSKDTLIADFFDQAQESYSELSDQRYHSTMFGRLFGRFNPMAMYSRGEYWIHMLNVYATLLHEKVVEYDPSTGNRRTISLYEALQKGNKVDGNTELQVRDNIYKLNGEKLEGLSDKYFEAIKRRIRYINQQCHGAMNKEDKGLIHQWMLGKMTMNFRQWMVEHYSRRWRQLHWDESIRDTDLSNFYNNTKVLLNDKKVSLMDALEMVDNGVGDGSFHYEIKSGTTTVDGRTLTDEILNQMLNKYAEDSGWRRGFKTDAINLFIDYIKEYKEYQTSANAYWNNLSETQKADVKQVLGEAFMIIALAGLSACMGDPNDHKGEWFYRMWMYTVKRCLFDEKATTVWGLPSEAKTIINNPVASVQTMAGLLYPIVGIGDINDTIKSGRYKGWNKYGRNVLKYTVPFYSQIDQLINMDTEDSVFGVFSNQVTR